MTKRAWLDKFRQQVTAQLGSAEAGPILSLLADCDSAPRCQKASCIAKAITQLERCASETVVTEILQGCSCEFSQSRITAIQQLYHESADLADFFSRLSDSGMLVEPFEVRDGWVVITKKPYRPDLQTRYPADSFAWYCHCGSIVKPLHGHLSPTICQCGAGFYRPLFSALFGAEVQIVVRESLLKGDSRCVIAVRIPNR